ncbi:MAG: sugar phosphate isomerase/epimerase [Lentisphaerae bacterium]|nr:sugar phosphate isomerase/epimerase [Lentisphaerota bacterium]
MSYETALPMIHAAGFQVISLGGNPQLAGYATAADRQKLTALLHKLDLVIDSVHAQFPEGDRLFAEDESMRQESVRLCKLALDAAAEVNGRVVVVHLLLPYDIPPGEQRDRMIAQGRRSIAELAKHAEARQVGLGLENGQRRDYDEVLFNLLDELPTPYVGLCYDSGHEHIQGRCFQILQQYGNRLLALHIHDNTGSDTHLLPFSGTVPWEDFGKAMAGLNFAGDLVLESGMAHESFQTPEDFLAEAMRRCQRLQKMMTENGDSAESKVAKE